MQTILSATSRGQVTLPKAWRTQFNTNFFKAQVKDGKLILTPILEETGDLESEIEKNWEDYKQGKFINHKELIEKYDL